MIQGKVWGSTEPLLVTPLVEIHRIRIRPQTECSLHLHEHKFNLFYVISGELHITVEKKDYALVDVTRLTPGTLTTVPPGEYHKFQNKGTQHVEALEVYYLSPIDVKDIVRNNVGGKLE